MGDLQCAATVLVARPWGITGLTAAVGDRKVAAVYADLPEAREVAERLGLTPVALTGEDLRSLIASLADVHRGETVVVVTDERADWLPQVPVVEVLVDADGWSLRGLPA